MYIYIYRDKEKEKKDFIYLSIFSPDNFAPRGNKAQLADVHLDNGSLEIGWSIFLSASVSSL